MERFLDYFGQSTAFCFLVGFAATLALGQPKPELGRALAKGFTASTIPTGATLLYCAFDLSVLPRLTELNVYIAAAGAIVLWMAVEELFIKS